MTSTSTKLTRRRFFLRSAGVTLALPALESLSSSVLAAGGAVGATEAKAGSPTRMVAIGNLLGFYPDSTSRSFFQNSQAPTTKCRAC